MSKIIWNYEYDHKNVKYAFFAAKIKNCNYWLVPESASFRCMTYRVETLKRHIRLLAEYYNITEVTIKPITKQTDTFVTFKRDYLFRDKYIESTDQSHNNVYYNYFLHKPIENPLVIQLPEYLYESQIFTKDEVQTSIPIQIQT